MSVVGLRIVHPGTVDSLSVAALRAAMGAVAHSDERGWVALLEAGYRVPRLEPGCEVDVEAIAVLVDFVSERIEGAAETAATTHESLAGVGVAEVQSRRDVVGGLVDFVLAARAWVEAARRHGGPARVEAGAPSVDDSSLPGWPPVYG